MNIIDVILIFIILGGLAGGVRRGFIRGMLDLLRWLGSLIVALWCYHYIDLAFAMLFGWSDAWRAPLAFVASIVLAVGSLGFLERRILREIPVRLHDSSINRWSGAIPGALRGGILAAILAALLLALPLSPAVSRAAGESDIANVLAARTNQAEAMLAPDLSDGLTATLNRLLVRPESRQFIDLPFTVREPAPRPDLEARLLELVNEERVSRGLQPLAADTALRRVARMHSADMFERGYFSHFTPEGADPFDRIRSGRIRFVTAGENLALAPTVRIAHDGLMNSPGHRANILRPQFGRVGIGIMDGGVHGLMVTQNFRN